MAVIEHPPGEETLWDWVVTRTSDQTLTPDDHAAAYEQLLAVEDGGT